MSARRPAAGPPALILTGGPILTMDPEASTAEAVAVDREGRISAVGSHAQVAALVTPETRTIDLAGRTLIPGFFDCHMHIHWLGSNLSNVNLASPPIANRDDIVRLLRERLSRDGGAQIVQGNFYDHNKLPGGLHLTRQDLDAVSIEVPVRIEHTSGHAAVVNSEGLRRLGITRDTANPPGGEIVRDASGEPTGLLLEAASWANLGRIIPPATSAQAAASLARASQYLLERGITSATDANTDPEEIGFFAEAAVTNALRVRVNLMVAWDEVIRSAGSGPVPTPDALQPIRAGLDGHRLHVGQAKLFSDGAITTRTCLLSAPFEGEPSNSGIAMHSDEELFDLIWKAHRAGWQIATHAIGDRAIDLVLEAYAEAQRRHTRHRPDHRIEHCMLLNEGLIARLRRQNVWSIGQPEFLSGLGDAYYAALGEERAMRLSPYASLDEQNVAQAFSSDCPVVPGSPLDGMRAAMERKTPSGRVLDARERVSAETALYAYTAAPAYASRVEADRGTIEAGKWADFAILTANPLTTPAAEWDAVAVAATFVGGECLFGAEQF